MVKIKKKVVLIKTQGQWKCLLYDIDISGHGRPLNALLYPPLHFLGPKDNIFIILCHFLYLKISCSYKNIVNGNFW